MTSLEPLFDTLSRLSIDALLRGAILILVGYVLIRLILKLVRRALNRTNLDAHISHLKGLGVEDKQSAGDVGKGILEGQGQSQAEYAQQSDKGCGRNTQLSHDHGK